MATLRLPELECFSGKHAEYESFSRRLKAYFISQNEKYKNLFKHAEEIKELQQQIREEQFRSDLQAMQTIYLGQLHPKEIEEDGRSKLNPEEDRAIEQLVLPPQSTFPPITRRLGLRLGLPRGQTMCDNRLRLRSFWWWCL